MILTVLDTETTGLSLRKHELLEVGLISYVVTNEGERLVTKKFETKIKPQHLHTASDRALEINGYSDTAWQDAPYVKEVLPEICEAISKSSILLGQNLIFDLKFIHKACQESGLGDPVYPPYIDTKQMADKLKNIGVIEKSGMDYLCERFNIQFEGRAHTALADCERTIKAWDALLELDPDYELWTFDNPYQPYR